MQVQLTLKTWKIVQDEKTKNPKVTGMFGLMMGEKEIATQQFNEGYQSKEIPFSDGLVNKLIALENDVKAELEKLLT